jgi:hypothetical protein
MTRLKIALSALLVLGTASAALAESADVIPGERNPDPIVAQPQAQFEGRNAYEGRAQAGFETFGIETPALTAEPYGPRSTPSLYGGGF